MSAQPAWPAIINEEVVERLIPAVQQAIGKAARPGWLPGRTVQVQGSDIANALLIILANVLEGSPSAATNMDMRKLAEVTGKELHQLMRDARQVRLGNMQEPGSVQ